MTAASGTAMLDVMRELSKRWSHQFTPAKCAEILPIWRDCCVNLAVEFWLPAAKELTRTWKGTFPPSNVEFAHEVRKYIARQLDEAERPITTYGGPVPVQSTVDRARADKVLRYIRDKVDSWRIAMNVWDRLLEHRHPDQRLAFENGHVPMYLVDEAIEAEAARTANWKAKQLAMAGGA